MRARHPVPIAAVVLVVAIAAGAALVGLGKLELRGAFASRPSPIPPPDVTLLTPEEVASLFDAPPADGFPSADGRYAIRVRRVGAIHVPSGAIVASDPGFDRVPFADRLPPGTADVAVLRARPPTGGELVAAAVVGDLRDLAGLRWSNAYRVGDDPARFGADDLVIYGVDSGTGSFASVEATNALFTDEGFYDRLLEAEKRLGWTEPLVFPVRDGLETAVFPSGAGDGGYPVWVGKDADGRARALLTDFGILAHPGPSATAASSTP